MVNLVPSIPYRLCVQNDCGDEGSTVLLVKPGRTPRSYFGTAVLKVSRTLPAEKPWKLVWYEIEGKPETRVECLVDGLNAD